MRKIFLPIAAMAAVSTAQAQVAAPASAPAAAPAAVPAAAPTSAPAPIVVTLPAGSDITVAPVAPLNSSKAKVGDTFKIVTTADVARDGVVIIPKGTEGLGRVTFSKGGGSFGKSGQMEVAFTSLTLNGKTVALQGKYRDQAEGNGGAATGAVLAAGLVGGFLVHGHSVQIAAGKVMHAQNVAPVTANAG